MRAVNLIPADLRRGGGAGAAGRTGGAVYIVMAALVALVIMAVVYGVTTHEIAKRKTDIATTTREAQVAEARAAALQPYVDIKSRRAARVSLISMLATKRFNWSVAMRHVAEALPADAVLTQLIGTDTPGSSTGGGGGGSTLRNTLPVPAVGLTGCSPTQSRVAAALDSLRRIPGVTVDALSLSDKGASTSSAACHGGPSFQVVVFYTNPTTKQAPQAGAAASIPVRANPGAPR
jgi:Tfp pilus assembly protein PilN